jgi:hypothetical protein
VSDTTDDNRLPFGLEGRLATCGPWHALSLAAYYAEVAGRQAILARPGLPPRRALLDAIHGAVAELCRIALLLAEEGGREAGAPDESADRSPTPSGEYPQAAPPRRPGRTSRPPQAPPGDTRPAR